MFLAFIALAAAVQAASTDGAIRSRHVAGTVYNRSTYETACGDIPIVIRFGNDGRRNRKGLVESVQVDGEEVAGAAKRLTNVAVDRFIDRIGIMNCGYEPERPVIRGGDGGLGMAATVSQSLLHDRKGTRFLGVQRRRSSGSARSD